MAKIRLAVIALLLVLGFGVVGGSNCDCDCFGGNPPPASPPP